MNNLHFSLPRYITPATILHRTKRRCRLHKQYPEIKNYSIMHTTPPNTVFAVIIKSLHRHQMTNDATAFRNHADIIPRFLSFVNIFREILALAGGAYA